MNCYKETCFGEFLENKDLKTYKELNGGQLVIKNMENDDENPT